MLPKNKLMDSSSQDSTSEPPHKRPRLDASTYDQSTIISSEDANSQSQSQDLTFSFLQTQKSLRDPALRKFIIKKGDNMKKRIDQLLRALGLLTDSENDNATKNNTEQRQVMVMSSGAAIQKQLSLIEILKSKVIENKKVKFQQFNKLDKYETIIKQNEILDKKIKVPVFYCLIRVAGKSTVFSEDDELSEWTQNG